VSGSGLTHRSLTLFEQAFADALIAATTLAYAAKKLVSAKAIPHWP
jgi:hypothetical protein